jgi:hypothetical protein
MPAREGSNSLILPFVCESFLSHPPLQMSSVVRIRTLDHKISRRVVNHRAADSDNSIASDLDTGRES